MFLKRIFIYSSLLFFLVSPLYGQRIMTVKVGKGKATVTHLDGWANVFPEGKETGRKLAVNDSLSPGDYVITGPASKLEIVLSDRSILRFADNSRFRIVNADYDEEQGRDVKVNITVGKAWAHVSKKIQGKGNFQLICENAVAGVRGTVYRMNVHDDKSVLIRVYDGTLQVTGKKPVYEIPVTLAPPQKIEGPKPVPGPHKVSLEEWVFIIKSIQQIMVKSDGTPEQPRYFTEQEDRDDWVDWNRYRDRILFSE